MGWKARVDHRYNVEYRIGTGVEEKKTYQDTTISLTSKKRNEDVMIFIRGLDKNEPTNHFRITSGGCTTLQPERAKEYLEKVVGYMNRTA
ncbi:hypothetical protein GF371_02335 [Candidatus Woesearchaeota archaeon]|nr:hypothetical protein [Candidatus Woesearchaeota archaeon]